MWYPWAMLLPRPSLIQLVQRALEEDIGRGDITTEACVAPDRSGRATLRAREASVFCGADVVREVFAQLDARVEVRALERDGTRVNAGTALMSLAGPARSLLEGERVA